MVDNFELIKSMFYFNEVNDMFFHLQIIRRAKDYEGENMKVREDVIKTYFIRSREHLDRVREEIMLLCEHYGARAYINVSAKYFSTLQSLMLVEIASDIHQGIIRDPGKCFNSATRKLKSIVPKWIVDVDDISMKESIKERLFELYVETWNRRGSNISMEMLRKMEESYIYAEVPTESGVHLIVRPFSTKAFSESFPSVDIYKDSMGTVLYVPNSLDCRYVCSVCGGTSIQVQAWVDANTHKYISDIHDDIECWCEDCMRHTEMRDRK